MNEDFIGSSGTLVGAVLETLGTYYQSALLDSIGQTLLGSLGALFYCVAIAVGLVSYAVTGKAKNILWLLIGPGLFAATVGMRSSSNGVDWRFGNQERNQEKVDKLVSENRTGASGLGTARVSSLFYRYDRLVSDIIQQLVSIIMNEKGDNDQRFLVAANLYSVMSSSSVTQHGFDELLHLAFLDQCGQFITLNRDLIDSRLNPDIRCEKARRVESERRRTISLSANARQLATDLVYEYPQLLESDTASGASAYCISEQIIADCEASASLDPELNPDLNSRIQSCIRGDNGAMVDYLSAVCQKAKTTMAERSDTGKGSDIHSSTDSRREEISRSLAEKGVTCPAVWNLVYAALHREGLVLLNDAVKRSESLTAYNRREGEESCFVTGLPEGMMKEFIPFTGNEEPLSVIRFLAKNLLRNEGYKGSSSAIAAKFADRSRLYTDIGVPRESEISFVERTETRNTEWKESSRMMVAAAKLPYMQGLLLYWLAIAFPFSALLLLVPGKHPGFFLWFGLWGWAKSWDLGYAIVYLLDDVLYSMFVVEQQAVEAAEKHLLSSDMSVAIMNMTELDPTFHIATYYSIVAAALLAIPAITGNLVIKGLNGGVGLISPGVSAIGGAINQMLEGSMGAAPAIGTAVRDAQTNTGMLGTRNRFLQAQHRNASYYQKASPENEISGNLKGAPHQNLDAVAMRGQDRFSVPGTNLGVNLNKDSMYNLALGSAGATGLFEGISGTAGDRTLRANERKTARNHRTAEDLEDRKARRQGKHIPRGAAKNVPVAERFLTWADSSFEFLTNISAGLANFSKEVYNSVENALPGRNRNDAEWGEADTANQPHGAILAQRQVLDGAMPLPQGQEGAYAHEAGQQLNNQKASQHMVIRAAQTAADGYKDYTAIGDSPQPYPKKKEDKKRKTK